MLYNIDINECINKYLNCNNILLLRQTFKKNNKFRILKDLKVIRNMNMNDKVLFNNDEYLLKINLYTTDNILKYYDLEKNNIDIINKICYINIKHKYSKKNSLHPMCEFLKNTNNMNNLHTIKLDIYGFIIK